MCSGHSLLVGFLDDPDSVSGGGISDGDGKQVLWHKLFPSTVSQSSRDVVKFEERPSTRF